MKGYRGSLVVSLLFLASSILLEPCGVHVQPFSSSQTHGYVSDGLAKSLERNQRFVKKQFP